MMKNKFTFLGVISIILIMLFVLSCEKPIDEFPNSNEAISFSNIDTTTIKAKAGESLEINVVLITDTIIDSLKIGYLIDTIGITQNITYAEISTKEISTGFDEINNKHQYLATIKMPSNAYGIRPFRPYIGGIGDYIRIVFRMEAGSKEYEKQLKVIIEP